jgi:phage terminase large subunit-like protein
MSHGTDVKKYCNDIVKGKIRAGIYTQKAVKRFTGDLKRQDDAGFLYRFVPAKADEVIDFAETLTIPDITTPDKKLRLLPWMKFIYYNLYGWIHKENAERRRFRSAYVEVARKNSKTTSLLFPIILYDFLTTESAESYFFARDEKQSYKAFNELKHIIKADKDLGPVVNETVVAITYENSRIAFFSSESGGLDSYKNSCTVIDEFHEYDNDRPITSSRYGGRARENSPVIIITSAGLDISGPCYAENEKARKLLNGLLTDETYFTVIYAYDEQDDWKDPGLFIKANPSLGTILKQDILENDLNDALITPSHQADFKSKTCGIWTNSTSGWIPLQKWDTETRNRRRDKTTFAGKTCCGALDLSSINDFTAYTLCFAEDAYYWLFHRFYIPEEQIREKYRVENINIGEWIEKGYVQVTPGPAVDYDFIFHDILEDSRTFGITEIAYDKWQAIALIDRLNEALPHTDLVEFDQSMRKMTNPTKEFERLIMEDLIVDPNPVMKWMIGNAVIKPDPNNNYKPLKEYKSSTRRIDGVITAIMSMDRCIANESGGGTDDFQRILALF